MTEVIVIFGISGAGKSTLIKKHIERHPDWSHLQAGSLIRSELKNIEHDKLRLEGDEAILQNQYLMVDAFWKEINSAGLAKVIFDGHSIIDTGEKLLPIPADVIAALKPTQLLFVKVTPSVILERRKNDTSRARPLLSEDEINEHQEVAYKQFIKYQQHLRVSSKVLENPISIT